MTDKDPKSDLNYRGIGTLSYNEVLDEIEDNKKTLIRSSIWVFVDFVILSLVGFSCHQYWQLYQSILFGSLVGFLTWMYVYAVLLYRSHDKKFKLRLGELE